MKLHMSFHRKMTGPAGMLLLLATGHAEFSYNELYMQHMDKKNRSIATYFLCNKMVSL